MQSTNNLSNQRGPNMTGSRKYYTHFFKTLTYIEKRLLKILAATIYAQNRPAAMRKPIKAFADLTFLPLRTVEQEFCKEVIKKIAAIDLRAHQDREFYQKIKKKTLYEIALEVEL